MSPTLGVMVAPTRPAATALFSGKLYTAPRRFQRRRQDVTAACAEFLSVWRDV
jgi:hypothetical protein